MIARVSASAGALDAEGNLNRSADLADSRSELDLPVVSVFVAGLASEFGSGFVEGVARFGGGLRHGWQVSAPPQ